MLKFISIFALLMVTSSAYPSVQILKNLEPINELLSTSTSHPISTSVLSVQTHTQEDVTGEEKESLVDDKNNSKESEIRSSSDKVSNLNDIEFSANLNGKGDQTNYVPITIEHHVQPTLVERLPLLATGIRSVYAPETIQVREPIVAKIGEYLQRIPTSVSHQSQTIVHNHAEVKTPIVAPAIRTISSQLVRAYHTPVIYTISNGSNRW